MSPSNDSPQAERGFIVLSGDDGGTEFAAARDQSGRSVERAEFAVSRSVLDEVIRTGRPVLSSDARSDERFVSKQSVLLLDLRSMRTIAGHLAVLAGDPFEEVYRAFVSAHRAGSGARTR